MHYHGEVFIPKDTDIKDLDNVHNLVSKCLNPYSEHNEEADEDMQLWDWSPLRARTLRVCGISVVVTQENTMIMIQKKIVKM